MNRKLAILLALLIINTVVILTYMEKVHGGQYSITNIHLLEGYSHKISYANGEQVELKIHCPQPYHSLEVIRYGKDNVTVMKETQIPGIRQDYPIKASVIGAGWETTYRFTIPDHWQNGLYAAKISNKFGVDFYITFVIRGHIQDLYGDIAILASTNTWDAYNNWGGISYYENDLDREGTDPYGVGIVSMLRPNPHANPNHGSGHLAGAEVHILSWMEREGYPYKLLADSDLHRNPDILDQFKVLIISTHNEYWSESMYDSLETFLDRGGNLLYLSGNGVYWKVVFNDDNQMEVRKDLKNHIFDGTQGGYWSKQLGRPESAILGVRFQNSSFSLPAPYEIKAVDHWIFEETELKNGDLIGEQGLNRVRNSSGGASGWETDQMDESTPSNSVLLAQGTNTTGKRADMIYYDHPGGGGVFSVGSITFGGSLLIDNDLTKVVNNVLDRFLSGT